MKEEELEELRGLISDTRKEITKQRRMAILLSVLGGASGAICVFLARYFLG